MRCPICIEQNTVRRQYVEEVDMRAHLDGMHLKGELAAALAKVLLKVEGEDK